MEQAICLDTPDKIDAFRILRLKGALKLETKTDMKMSRGRTAYSLVKEEFGFKGNKAKVLRQLEQHIWDNLLKINECAVYNEEVGWVLVERGDSGYHAWNDLQFSDNDGNTIQVRPEDFNKDRNATDKAQREDMMQQSMFGWRV